MRHSPKLAGSLLAVPLLAFVAACEGDDGPPGPPGPPGGSAINAWTAPDDVLADIDVLYMTRVQKERFGDPAKTKGGEAMVDSIGEMVENDPNFVGRLSSQLKKLSKS